MWPRAVQSMLIVVVGVWGIAFQYARLGDPAGVGRGILVFDLAMYEKARRP